MEGCELRSIESYSLWSPYYPVGGLIIQGYSKMKKSIRLRHQTGAVPRFLHHHIPGMWHTNLPMVRTRRARGTMSPFTGKKKKSGSNREEKEGLSPYCPCLVSQLNCSHTLMQHSLEMWGVQGGWSLCDHWALSPTRHWSYLGRPEKPLQRRPWGHWFD